MSRHILSLSHEQLTAFELVAEDTISRDQILITHQQLLIDRPCNVRQQGLPIHASVPLHCFLAHWR